ncbi:MAG: hypothetical protein LKJ21_00220 [Oscillospiraceae bacterium]|jgi:hypothetical protein|nr:hypothetical protein [Oscillospiraceae bacterium]
MGKPGRRPSFSLIFFRQACEPVVEKNTRKRGNPLYVENFVGKVENLFKILLSIQTVFPVLFHRIVKR